MEKYFIAAMGGAEGLGHRSIARLVEFFGSAEAAWSADLSDLMHSGVRRQPLEAFITFRNKFPNAPNNLVAYCQRHQFKLCSFYDADYPPILKEIKIPPMFFYYRGQLEPQAFRIGIVGSRENTRYGQDVALELGEQLAAAGLTVVSGAARGIDTFAHNGALKSGRTVAVLGCGIEIAFRSGKRNFFERIVERGVVLSEFPPQLAPNQGTFPTRNRIIAGLCKGVVIVEAGKKSGALITTTYAADFGRDVFVIPGRVDDEKSLGCNELIRDGATLIKGAQDVLDEYDIADAPAKSVELDGVAAEIFAAIPSDKFITDDEILMRVDIAPNELQGVLLELEMERCITADGNRYKRKPNIHVVAPAKSVELDGVAAEIFAAIPSDKFITDDEILMRVDIASSDLPNVLLELERLNYVAEENHRYKRKPNIHVVEPAKSVELDGVAAEVFAAIPSDKFITDDEILMQVESVTPSELPDIMIALELKGYVTVEAGRYKRKL